MYSATRRIEVDMAHRIPLHGSKCRQLHGHRYIIEATVEAPLQHEGEQQGMVYDFGFLKEVMVERIHNACDHGTVLFENDPLLEELAALVDHDKTTADAEIMGLRNVCAVPFVPTAENLAGWWFGEILSGMQEDPRAAGVALLNVTVWETPNCKVTYPSRRE